MPAPAVLAQCHERGHEPEDRGLRRIELVTGLHHHDAVARLEERAERRRHAFARPQHDGDLLLRVRPAPVEPVGVVRYRAPQLGKPERKRVLIELVARIPDAGQQLLHGEIERLRPGCAARGQQFAQGHRFDLGEPCLRPAEHRRDPGPHHVVRGRLVRESLREIHGAMRDGEPGHPADQGLLDVHALSPASIMTAALPASARGPRRAELQSGAGATAPTAVMGSWKPVAGAALSSTREAGRPDSVAPRSRMPDTCHVAPWRSGVRGSRRHVVGPTGAEAAGRPRPVRLTSVGSTVA